MIRKSTALTTIQTDRILHNALAVLSREKNAINNLNVFPVPDGDTGLNMTLTLQGALNSLENYNIESLSIQEYLKHFADGMILNSRGCSGVILALYCNGVAESFLQDDSFNGFSNNDVSNALKNGYELAFSETTNPREGTILTMMKVFSEHFAALSTNNSDPVDIIKKTIPVLEKTLEDTPEMLPVLKKAGVVDSGAMGFLVLIKGITTELEYNRSIIKPLLTIASILTISRYVRSLAAKKKYGKKNRLVKTIISNLPPKNISNISLANILRLFNNLLQKKGNNNIAEAIIQKSEVLYNTWNPNIQYRYCTEFILEGDKINKQELQSQLEPLGDSLLIIESGNSFKIHIHTNKPKIILKKCSHFGQISSTKIDDMKKQHHNLISEDKAYYDKDNAVLLTVNGDGFAEILKGLGATDVLVYKKIKPSVRQIQNALIKTRAKNIITATDDSDILASLKSAITLCKTNIELIGTQNIISIISMMYNYSNVTDVMQNAKMMRESLNNIRFCKIARATRNFEEDNLSVQKGDFFTIYQNKIILSSKQIDKAIIQSISEIRENESLVTLYKGRMNKNDDKLIPLLKSKFSSIEFEIYNGGQDRYNYYITFE